MNQADFDPRRHVVPPDEMRGRVVMVTGAGDGIGRAVSLALARAGAEVILLGRTVRKLEAVHAEIAKLGAPEASIVPLDLERALAADYEAVAAAVERRYGRLDGLLHNAALLGTLTPIEQYDVPTFMRVMHVNLTAAFVLTRQLLPLLRTSSDAAMLFTSSGVGNRGRAYWGAYSISKFAVEGMAQVLSHELEGTTQVRVNVIEDLDFCGYVAIDRSPARLQHPAQHDRAALPRARMRPRRPLGDDQGQEGGA